MTKESLKQKGGGKVFIIDGSSYIHRSFHAIKGLSSSKGLPTNAIYGFTSMLQKVIKDTNPSYLVVVFDMPGKTFRHKLFEDYKANRAEMSDELKPQIPYIREVVKAYNIAVAEKSGYEADDLIGSIARKAEKEGFESVIITGDKDFCQIVSDKITLWDTMKDKKTTLTEVKGRFGITGDGVTDVFALMGDSSDNIPGVSGIGEKTAVELIKQFHSLERLIKNTPEIKRDKLREILSDSENIKKAHMSKELSTIKIDFSLVDEIDKYQFKEPDVEKLNALFRELEFTRFIKELAPVKKVSSRDYHLILTEKEFNDLLRELKKAKEFAIDVETTSLDPIGCKIVGVSISHKIHQAFYIPLRHNYLGAPEQLPAELVLSNIKPLLEDKTMCKIGQNIKFDIRVFKQSGMSIKEPIDDIMIASYLLNPARRAHGLEEIAQEYLGHQITTYKDVVGKGKKEITFDKVEVNQAKDYSAEDADVTFLASKILLPRLREEGLQELYEKLEMPLVEILAEMETTGVKIDTELLHTLSDEFQQRIERLKKPIYKLAGKEFNIDSPKQLQVVLYEELKLKAERRIKTGFSTDNDTLSKLAYQHELPAKVLEYRSFSKLKSTYVDALAQLVNPRTSRVHTSYNQTVTATGRLSSSEPNLQNIPVRTEEGRRIREAFIPEKGYLLISADYSQIELRLLAHFSQDKSLLSAFEYNQDIHTRTASELFNISEEMVSADMRRLAKTINFGVIYGMSSHGLATELKISHGEAQSYIDSYFVKYPGVKLYIDNSIKEARKNGYVITLLGRKRQMREINSENKALKGFAERVAVNAPLQGTAADLMKLAMINIFNRLKIEELKSRMILQVHDELVFEVISDEEKKVISLIRDEMENLGGDFSARGGSASGGKVSLSVPLRVDISKGRNWADLKPV
ncbi:MAG: DNA polymerase I, partial [Planctomycetota bacterium]|nr:DNA polymerase I [Planctomycetota bacterium]